MATQTYGEAELQVLRDVHWKALTVLDKLHKRDRRARNKTIAEYTREASKGASGVVASPHEATCSLVPKGCGTKRGDQPAGCGGIGGQERVAHLACARRRVANSRQAVGDPKS